MAGRWWWWWRSRVGGLAARRAAQEAGRDQDGGSDRGRDATHDGGPAAAPDAARRAAHVLEAEVTRPDVVGAALQLADQGLLAHRSSSPSPGRNVAGVRSRSEAIARAFCDLTVPTEMPSTSAVSASVSCS